MRVSNMVNNNGNKVANQFVITEYAKDNEGRDYATKHTFQSYDSIIAEQTLADGSVTLDKYYWDYSQTTGKYRNIFLNETKKETEAKIKSGEYKLANLN